MAKDKFLLYGDIQKFEVGEDDSLLVSGIASTEAVDADGEVVTADAMRKAIPSYLQTGTVREMHQPIAAGTPISAHVDDDGKTHFTAKIVDKSTIQKIKLGVLKGFSIGGKAIKKVGNKITEILLKDISVVDLPNNPESFFTVIKFEGKEEKTPKDDADDEKCPTCKEMVKKCLCKSREKSMKKMLCAIAGVPETTCDEELAKVLGTRLLPAQKTPEEKPTLDVILQKIEALEKMPPGRATAAAGILVKMEDGTEGVLSGAEISKALATSVKLVADTQKQLETAERTAIIAKMDGAGRVAFNPATGKAFTRAELDTLPVDMLKFASANSPVIPLEARAIYKGEGKPQLDPTLKGSARVQAAWEAEYGDLDVMKARLKN